VFEEKSHVTAFNDVNKIDSFKVILGSGDAGQGWKGISRPKRKIYAQQI
jgi:hypothetical protein